MKRILPLLALLLMSAADSWAAKIDLSKLANYTNYEAKNGDVITAVNGKKVTNLAEFYEELAAAQKSVNFDIYSNGGTITTGTYRF